MAHVMVSIKFCLASDLGMLSGSCEPVTMIGLANPESINESADAV